MATYAKAHCTSAQFQTHWLAKGLAIGNAGAVDKMLDEVGAERLRIYCLARRSAHIPGRPFLTGTTFDEIVSLYRFDEALRLLVFSYSSKVEVIVRNIIAEKLSALVGPHAHLSSSIYKSPESKVKTLTMLSSLCNKKFKDERFRNYYSKHDDPILPSIWLLKECFTFGTSNHFMQNLTTHLQKDIAKTLGLPTPAIAKSWMECFVDVRNACAHHDRIFNRKFQKAPVRLKNSNVPDASHNPNKIFAAVQCMAYIVNRFDAGCCNPVQAIGRLIAAHPQVRMQELQN